MELFSNREIAVGFWATLILALALTKSEIRASLWRVLVAFCNKRILQVLALVSIYLAAMIYALEYIGLWDTSHLKITIVWAISVAVVMVFRGVERSDDPYYFRRSIKDILKVIVVIEFVISLYSFNIWVELASVPIVTILLLTQAYSEEKEEHSSLRYPVEFLFLLYVLALLVYTVYRITSDFDEFANIGNFVELALPPLMSIVFLPFMYPFLAYLAYTQAFIRLDFALPSELVPYAKRRSLLRFRLDRILLNRWARIIAYQDIYNKHQLKKSIDRVRFMQMRERRPSVVVFENGWSPRNAPHYLADEGIKAGDYNPGVDGSWRASSPYLELEGLSYILRDNIAFYIEGSARRVLRLKLVLNVNNPTDDARARTIFLDFCDKLSLASLKVELDPHLRSALLEGRSAESIQRKRVICIERYDWEGAINGGYELTFTISHPSYESIVHQPWLRQ